MNEREAFIRTICDLPEDDTVRLVFADWLDEHDDQALAEFIRVQIGMARLSFDERIAAELPTKQTDLIVIHGRKWVPEGWLVTANPDCLEGVTEGAIALLHRGFIAHIRTSAHLWLQHADDLSWHPTQTMECPKCQKDHKRKIGHTFECECRGTGRITRPCPATAQPVERVTLTAWLEGLWEGDRITGEAVFCFPDGREISEAAVFADRQRRKTWDETRHTAKHILEAIWSGIEFTLMPTVEVGS